jgi:glycosyltransferase involved in cell wall biosynthesis
MPDTEVRHRPYIGLYVARLDLLQPHLLGVAAKIRAQVDALRTLPAIARLMYPSRGSIQCDGKAVKHYGNGGLWRRLTYYLFFYFDAAALAAGVDFVYLRYQGSSPALLWMLRKVRKRNPAVAIFVEIPTYPYDSAAATVRARFLLAIDRAWRRRVFRQVDRVVTFSRDREIFGVPAVQTDNGVDVDALPLLPAPPQDGPLRMVCVANVSYWHGYDRVISGMARYRDGRGRREIHFDIVGSGFDLQALRDLARREGLEDHVHFHGPRRGTDLTDTLARCHVGISCIALHRKGSDTSDLKSREYCARGLPFVIGYADRDFPPDFPFCHQVPADDSAIDIDAVIAFEQRLRLSHADYRREMRAYAVQRLAWPVKMQPVVEALRDHLNARGVA